MRTLKMLANATQHRAVGARQLAHCQEGFRPPVPDLALRLSDKAIFVGHVTEYSYSLIQETGQACYLVQDGAGRNLLRTNLPKIYCRELVVPLRYVRPESQYIAVAGFRIGRLLKQPNRSISERYRNVKLPFGLRTPQRCLQSDSISVLSARYPCSGKDRNDAKNCLYPCGPFGFRHASGPVAYLQQTVFLWRHMSLRAAIFAMVLP